MLLLIDFLSIQERPVKLYIRQSILIGMSFLLFMTVNASHARAPVIDEKLNHELTILEKNSGGRLGVALINTENNDLTLYRADERFAMCSTSKVVAVSALLKKSESDKTILGKNIALHEAELVTWSPVTEKNITTGMTLGALSAATLQYSDNTAMNSILNYLGGPSAVTAFARSIGDEKFRQDRTEPELNTAIPGDERDTSTPLAMATTLQKLTLGDALATPQRQQLVEWLKGNTTGAASIKAGLPEGWIVGDKTGSGDYGTTNDIAVIWPPEKSPLILVIFFTQPLQDAQSRKDILAEATKIVVSPFVGAEK
ncbi:class A beta-lactamase [Salmonella enterica subsp. enterica serovar Heidelberg]|jgi:beta-lactamase class A|nr:class A beta-lactamase [Salmonella enterica subsp. enterica serovar Newport]EDI2101364.1 class A beta-lactamase [Salmonella enterica subsp. enterica serovar Newport]EDI4396469.1 class A beta-lactamase [Salmonella enterica subsp. enterica serovar Heidelberg]EDI4397112.1 class A beta-lactamase [Salmonella enterica subsp. enterica serovar Heidelberg]EDI4414424.1 class A beta-lactamase [Salmonella enterica subsp. enterica serovar Heidelberg]